MRRLWTLCSKRRPWRSAQDAVEGRLAGVAEGRVAEVVAHRDRLDQVLVELQRPRHGARERRHLERVGQPGAVVVAGGRHEDLGLVLEPPERGGVEDPVAVALEGRAEGARLLGRGPARRRRRARPAARAAARAARRPAGSLPPARAGSGRPTDPRSGRPSGRPSTVPTRHGQAPDVGRDRRRDHQRPLEAVALGRGSRRRRRGTAGRRRRRRSRRACTSRRGCAGRRRGTCSAAGRPPRGAPGRPGRCRGRRSTGPGSPGPPRARVDGPNASAVGEAARGPRPTPRPARRPRGRAPAIVSGERCFQIAGLSRKSSTRARCESARPSSGTNTPRHSSGPRVRSK